MKRINTKELWKRLEDLGYDTLAEFHKKSQIPRTYETLRAAFRSGKVKSAETYFLIMKYLGFDRKEIKERLLSIGDKEIATLITEVADKDPFMLTPWHEALISMAEKLRKADPKLSIITSVARTVANGLNIDISKELEVMERVPYKDGK